MSPVSTIKHINEFQVDFSNHRIFQSKMSELFTVLYINSPKISDTYEHSIHDHRFHLQFSDHRIFESKTSQVSSTVYITV